MNERKLILYIAMSLDGYIAKPNDDLDFLSMVEKEGEDYGYSEFIKTIDTVILGRKTYDKVMSMGIDFPHADKETYIITRTRKPTEGNIHYYSGDLKTLVNQLKAGTGRHIFCDGGAEIVNELLKEQLIDEIIVSVIPVMLGEGVRLFNDGRPEQKTELLSARSFEKGLVQLHYRCIPREQ